MLQPIKWEEWENTLHTSGVVQKMKAKYENFMKAEYSVEAAVSQIGNKTEKMRQLEVANEYNFMLYFTHYMLHLDQIETMRNMGDLQELSTMEMVQMNPEVDTLHSINIEMGNMAPEDYNEDGIFTRVCT